MKNSSRLLALATLFVLIEQARNRLAMLLVALFVPAAVALVGLAVSDAPVHFRLDATGEVLVADGNRLTQITGGLNAVTLIIGFMMFATTFNGTAFDQRLVMAGYPRVPLGLARVACLLVSSLVVAAYATAVICCYWSPHHPLLLAVSFFGAAMTYGTLGVVLGTLLRREVEGMFAIVMISVVDVALQNPLLTNGTDSGIMSRLPSYGAMQIGAAAGFSAAPPPLGPLVAQLAWFTGSALLGLLIFHRRTRSALRGPARTGSQAPR